MDVERYEAIIRARLKRLADEKRDLRLDRLEDIAVSMCDLFTCVAWEVYPPRTLKEALDKFRDAVKSERL